MASSPKATFIPDVLEEHFEELAFLWGQRRAALRSPAYTLKKVRELEERIEAHVQGLLVPPPEHVRALLEPALSGDDRLAAFAAGYALLRMGHADRVAEAWLAAKGDCLAGLTEALAHGLPPSRIAGLQCTRPAAAEVLAFHGVQRLELRQLEAWLADEEPGTRRAAWRSAALAGVMPSPQFYAAGLRDADPAVRSASLEAAVWHRHPALFAVFRDLVAKPSAKYAEAYLLYGVLASPEDLARIRCIGEAAALGPVRFEALGCYGHPAIVDLLLTGMKSDDPKTAAAAGIAFTKITGHDVRSGRKAPAAQVEDAFEGEFVEEVALPDADRARSWWAANANQWAGATRVCRGFALPQAVPLETIRQLDMESRRETLLRMRYFGSFQGGPTDLERFPLRA